MNDQAVNQIKTQLKTLEDKIKDASAMLKDEDLKELAEAEIQDLNDQKKALENSLKTLTTDYSKKEAEAQGSMDISNALMEIRPGAGGEEAKIWADDILRMYLRFIEKMGLKYQMMEEGTVKIIGRGAYGLFKYESGVHRVQRVPETESQGRIHTSTASVAVLPEVKPQHVEVKEEDLDWKFSRSGGSGGQNVNKVNTAVLLTHIPTGIVINCRQERTQQRNRDIALELLRSQLWEKQEEKRLSEIKEKRRAAVGTQARAEKIRTYNFPSNRVTDHRIHESWHNLEEILDGEIKDIIKALKDDEEKDNN